jgi:hypothetical protein
VVQGEKKKKGIINSSIELQQQLVIGNKNYTLKSTGISDTRSSHYPCGAGRCSRKNSHPSLLREHVGEGMA